MPDGRVQLRADCNRGGARYDAGAGRTLTFSPAAITKMGCPPGSQGTRVPPPAGGGRRLPFRGGRPRADAARRRGLDVLRAAGALIDSLRTSRAAVPAPASWPMISLAKPGVSCCTDVGLNVSVVRRPHDAPRLHVPQVRLDRRHARTAIPAAPRPWPAPRRHRQPAPARSPSGPRHDHRVDLRPRVHARAAGRAAGRRRACASTAAFHAGSPWRDAAAGTPGSRARRRRRRLSAAARRCPRTRGVSACCRGRRRRGSCGTRPPV